MRNVEVPFHIPWRSHNVHRQIAQHLLFDIVVYQIPNLYTCLDGLFGLRAFSIFCSKISYRTDRQYFRDFLHTLVLGEQVDRFPVFFILGFHSTYQNHHH